MLLTSVIFIIFILVLIICIMVLGTLENPGFISEFDILLYRSPFIADKYEPAKYWVAANSWLMAVMILTIIMILISVYRINNGKSKPYITYVPTYASLVLAIIIYYATAIIGGRYTLTMSDKQLKPMQVGLCSIAMIVICIVKYKKFLETQSYSTESQVSSDSANSSATSPSSSVVSNVKAPVLLTALKTSTKNNKLYLIITVVLFTLTYPIWLKAALICADYSPNYGCYKKPDRERMLYIENNIAGNFFNYAVDTEEGLFFLDVNPDGVSDDYTIIRKYDSNGQITDVYNGESAMYAISYDSGNLFLLSDEKIFRFNLQNKIMEGVVSSDNNRCVVNMCVLDGKLYYMEYDDKDTFATIKVFDLTDGNLGEPRIYLSDVRPLPNIYPRDLDNNLLYTYLGGETPMDYIDREDKEPTQRYDGQDYYICETNDYSDFVDGNKNYDLSCFLDEENCFSYLADDDVFAFTIFQNKLYYAQLCCDGIQIRCVNMDGSEFEILHVCDCEINSESCYTLDNSRLIIGQGKLLLISDGCYMGNSYSSDVARPEGNYVEVRWIHSVAGPNGCFIFDEIDEYVSLEDCDIILVEDFI